MMRKPSKTGKAMEVIKSEKCANNIQIIKSRKTRSCK